MPPLALTLAAALVARAAADDPASAGAPPAFPAPTDAADAGPRPAPAEAERGGFVEVFPSVRADRGARAVEFDTEVIADLTDPKRKVFLEVVACARDSKEHESLVMTVAKPSHVHAALLLVGFTPGTPVTWPEAPPGRPVPAPSAPTGDAVKVELVWTDPATMETRVASPLEWVINERTGARASDLKAGFVFAGSVMIRRADPQTGGWSERYDADSAGTLVGLASFGSETIAWTRPFSPESAIEAPVWIADRARVPPMGTRVVVRLTPEDGKSAGEPRGPTPGGRGGAGGQRRAGESPGQEPRR